MVFLNKLFRAQLSVFLCSCGFATFVWQRGQDMWCELDKILLGIKGNTSCLHFSKCKFQCQNKNQRLSLKPSKKSLNMYGYFVCILYGPHLHVIPNEARRGHQSPWNWSFRQLCTMWCSEANPSPPCKSNKCSWPLSQLSCLVHLTSFNLSSL